LVATKAAPLSRRDAIPGLADDGRDLTGEESTQWTAGQNRLAWYWRIQLGLEPLPNDPTILTWHTSHTNAAIENVLLLWA